MDFYNSTKKTKKQNKGRNMKAEDLKIVLEQHELWIDSEGKEGSRADLRGKDLSGANLRFAYLTGASFAGANLTDADLSGANLIRTQMPEGFINKQKIKVQKVGETELSGPDM